MLKNLLGQVQQHLAWQVAALGGGLGFIMPFMTIVLNDFTSVSQPQIWVMSLIMGVVLGGIIGGYCHYRLGELHHIIDHIKTRSHDDLEQLLNPNRSDEIGQLGVALNALMKRLEKRIKELTTVNLGIRSAANAAIVELERHRQEVDMLNKTLDERVATRTKELEDANRRMEAIAEALYSASERANAANQAKSQFLANMSHELRTPLSSIILYNDLILRGAYGDLTPKQRDRLTKARESAVFLLQLINDVLDLAKIEAGELVVAKQIIQINKILLSAEDYIHPLIKDKEEVQFHLDMPSDLPAVVGDSQRIQQVVLNLLSNAAKFTHVGEIRLKAWPFYSSGKDHLPVGISKVRPGNWVAVSVIDSGIGIPDDKHEMIFDEFKQVDDSNTRQYGGTGLGLAICKRLIAAQNGQIVVQSKVDNGSTFTFILPQATDIPEDEDNVSDSTNPFRPDML